MSGSAGKLEPCQPCREFAAARNLSASPPVNLTAKPYKGILDIPYSLEPIGQDPYQNWLRA